VKVSGTALTGSLTSTVIAGPPSAQTSSVDMPSHVTVFPNELPVHLEITAFDALGNRITRGGANFEVRVEDGEEGDPLDLTDNRDGTYTTTFNPGTGVFLVHVRLDGVELKDSPFQLIVSFF
jgi:filamin/ABP280 repeat protein